jgi:hypothetical protein
MAKQNELNIFETFKQKSNGVIFLIGVCAQCWASVAFLCTAQTKQKGGFFHKQGSQ